MCVTWLIHVWDMNHWYQIKEVKRDAFWHTHVCDMTHSYGTSVTWLIHMGHVWHDSVTCVTWVTDTSWRKSKETPFRLRMCVTWLIHVCDVTQIYVCHDSFTCVTRSHVWHDSLICATWLIPDKGSQRRRYSALACVWHDSFVCVTWLIRMCDSITRVTWCMDMCDMTDRYQMNKPNEMKNVKRDEESQKRWRNPKEIKKAKRDEECQKRWRKSKEAPFSLRLCVTWLIHVCDVTPSCLWRNTSIPHRGSQGRIQRYAHVSDMVFSCEWHEFFVWVTWFFRVCEMTHSCVWHDSLILDWGSGERCRAGYACVRHTHEQIRYTYDTRTNTCETHVRFTYTTRMYDPYTSRINVTCLRNVCGMWDR